jgi:hypothetical protein
MAGLISGISQAGLGASPRAFLDCHFVPDKNMRGVGSPLRLLVQIQIDKAVND